jgi:ribose transport system permease protein
MLPFAAILAIVAIGQTIVVQQRGLDLSVPGMISLAALIVTRYPNLDEHLIVPGILLTIAVCALFGLINGISVSFLNITPLVATLAINAFLLGFVQWYSGGFPTGAVDSLNGWAIRSVIGIPNTVIAALILIAVVTIVMKASIIGRRFEAVGANPDAARASGVRVRRYVLGSYVIAGVCYAIAGIILAAFLKTPGVFVGETYLLPSVAAVVLGGTALTGGVGSVIASAVAALFLTQLGQLVLSIGAPTSVQLLIQSATIAIGMGLRGIHLQSLGHLIGGRGRSGVAAAG